MSDLVSVGVGIAVLAIIAWIVLRRVRRAERERLNDEARQDAARRVVKGRERMRAGRGDDPDERLRRNDGHWE